MSTNEIYFLVLVCGAFAALAVGLAIATIRYRHWDRRPAASASRTVRRGR